jgi:hypothetical protein
MDARIAALNLELLSPTKLDLRQYLNDSMKPADIYGWQNLDERTKFEIKQAKEDSAMLFELLQGVYDSYELRDIYMPLMRPGEFVSNFRVNFEYGEALTNDEIWDMLGDYDRHEGALLLVSKRAIKRTKEELAQGIPQKFKVNFKVQILDWSESYGMAEHKREHSEALFDRLIKEYNISPKQGTEITRGGIQKQVEDPFAPNEAPTRMLARVKGMQKRSAATGEPGAAAITPEAVAAMEQTMLRMLPAGSFMKSKIHRETILGYTTDFQRAMAEHTRAASYHIARTEYAYRINEKFIEMENFAKAVADKGDYSVHMRVLNEFRRRDQAQTMMHQTPEIVSKVKEIGFLWMLGSASHSALGMTQPFVVGFAPLAAEFGYAKAMGAYGKALKTVTSAVGKEAVIKNYAGLSMAQDWGSEAKRTTKIHSVADALIKKAEAQFPGDERFKRIMEDTQGFGLIEMTYTQDLKSLQQGDNSIASRTWRTTMDMARFLPHSIEVHNRVFMALATYELIKDSNMSELEMSRKVRQVIEDTQFNYNEASKPPLMQVAGNSLGVLTGPVFMFKIYGQNILNALVYNTAMTFKGATPQERKIAFKTLVNLIGAHALFAGFLGGILVEPIRWAIMLAAFLFGDPEDPDEWWDDPDAAMRRTMGDSVWADAFNHGATRLLGIDAMNRIGLHRIITAPGGPEMTAEETAKDYMLAFFGAPGGILLNASRGVDQFQRENYAGAFSAVAPKGLRDLITAFNLSREGMLDSQGRIIYGGEHFGLWDVAVQGFGFNSDVVAMVREARHDAYGKRGRRDITREKLRKRGYRIQRYGSTSERQAWRQEWRNYNMANRETPMTMSSFRRGYAQWLKAQREAQRQKGVLLTKRDRYLVD